MAFESKPLDPSRTAEDFEGRSLDDARLHEYLANHAPDAGWQEGRWDLPALTLVGLYYQPELDLARTEHALGLASVQRAGELPNPTVSWSPGYNTSSSGVSPWIVGFNLDVPLEASDKRDHRTARARQRAEAARCAIASAAWDVRARIRSALVALQSSRQRAALLDEQAALQERIVELLEAQRSAGAVSVNLVTTARIALDRGRLAREDATRDEDDAIQRLAQALGIRAGALADADIRFEGLGDAPELDALDVRRQALRNRADLLGALAEYAASQSELQLEIARQFPDLHLGPGYELDQGDNKWSLGLSFELPVLNRNRGAIAEAEAAREVAAARFMALQAKVIGEVDHAEADYAAARRRVARVDTLRTSLEDQVAVAQSTTALGETSRLALLGAQLELAANSLERLDTTTRIQDALGRLEDAMQSPATLPESLWAVAPDRSAR